MRHAAAALLAALALLAAGCGEKPEPTSAAGGQTLTVSAASSLKTAFDAYAKNFTGATVRAQYAGSDELAAQIEQGVKPDVYAAANTSLPDDLHKDGLVEKPVVFASNTLVLAVPKGSDISSIEDLTGDVTLAIGDEGVPVGDYTREVLGRLPKSESDAILDNVRSLEPDVAGIVGKLTQGAVDAGFVYITDVVATDGALTAIQLPKDLQPNVAYGAAVVDGAANPDGAQAFIDGLLSGQGAAALKDAGFGPPPSN